MRQLISLTLIAVLALSLNACGKPDRKMVDSKLEKACQAAVKSLYQPEDSLDFKSKTFSSEKSHDNLSLRRVHLMAHYVQNGGHVLQKDSDCWFEETSGMTGYKHKLYRLENDGLKFGNYDGKIEGDFQELLRVQEEADKVLLK